jgi:L-ascorbate metabolism protein UlaG (beta-lactamase superfamily)
MITTLTIVILVSAITFFYMRQNKFGANPSGERLARMQQSPNFKDGKFQNLEVTPDLTEGSSMLSVSYDFLFKKKPRQRPVDSIPSMKTDLATIVADSNVLVWFGHSSYYMQIDGKRFLVDPVFSGNASPIPGTVKAFDGTDRYTVDDLPEIDYLIISHDHYDHVDHETLIQLKTKVKKVICGLGVGAHFERWGYAPDVLLEKDWNESVEVDSGFVIHTTPARHFSGRGFSRNNTLWMSYVIHSPSLKIYIGGDSGYGSFMADIGNKFGPIDLVILDDGQYDDKWRYIHMHPHEVVQAAIDLKAKRLFPVHSSKFVMANHPWDEPLIKVSELNKTIPLVTPIIGEVVRLSDTSQQFTPWWVGLK